MRLSRAFGTAAALSFVGGVLIAIASWTITTLSLMGDVLIAAPFMLAAASLLAFACAGTYERGRFRTLNATGMAAAYLAAAAWIAVSWLAINAGQSGLATDIANIAAPLLGWSLLTAIIAVVTRYRMRSVLGGVLRAVTVLAGAALALAIVGVVWLPEVVFRDEETAARFIGSLLVAILGGMLLTLVIARRRVLELGTDGGGSRLAARAVELETRIPLTLICPRCTLRQTMETGGDRCARCGLRIGVFLP